MLAGNEIKLGRDLKLQFGDLGADLAVKGDGDLETISGKSNLLQAMLSRLNTGKGELADIGHADYGSRLNEALGLPNTERTYNYIKVLVQECLSEEPRVKEVLGVNIKPDGRNPNKIEIEITLIPAEGLIPINMVYPFNLEVV